MCYVRDIWLQTVFYIEGRRFSVSIGGQTIGGLGDGSPTVGSRGRVPGGELGGKAPKS